MVDFLDRDDQDTVVFAEDVLKAAARHHIMVHFHGVWKPTGLDRTFPNLMNHEGALNLEYNKWGKLCTPEHDIDMAMTRLIAGPIDYHLGGFHAVPRDEFEPKFVGPSVMGTRAHQLGLYVVFDNPTPMVADDPANYKNQPGFDFIKIVPTVWDETRVLETVPGRLFVTARRKGQDWHIGAIAAGPKQKTEISLDFLGDGEYEMTEWFDGPDGADPNVVLKETKRVKKGDKVAFTMATDGGFVALLQR